MRRRRAPEPLLPVHLSARALTELAKAAAGHALTIDGLRLELSAQQLRELSNAAQLYELTPASLASVVIARFLRNRRGNKTLTGQPAELDIVALERKRLLEAWHRARSRAGKGGQGRATDKFLSKARRAEGVPLSRATLFNWAKAYANGGIAALVDLRKAKAHARPSQAAVERTPTRLRRPSNGRSKAV